ncbi:CCHC-type domain-containing protein [Nephila pilipes]|uniref:CCHC-type domain-containing protein n=1 Tax=Nephila pilipes TaxID=299642 RepID=A0A8X6NCI8_NEPPI|nr:CCHC-type domain-containing protein [Nephila pilipes]
MVKTRSQATMADSGNAELLALLAEMKKSMEIEQEEMRIGQEEMKKRMEKGQDEMRVHVETQVEGIKKRGACQHIGSSRNPRWNLTDLTPIERALESLFGDSHLTQFYRTELKTRRQKPGESLQVLATDEERLMSLAYAECPLDIQESLAA